MKRMKRIDQFIDVVGTWDGTDDSELINWLTENKYVYQIQTEDDEQVSWRIKPRRGRDELTEEESEPRRQIVILGTSMYDETTIAKNTGVLVIGENGRLASYDLDIIEEQFEDV